MDIFFSVWLCILFFSGRQVCTKTSINKDRTFGGLWKRTFKAAFSLACERKESLQLHLWNLNIGIKKIYAKFCLAEMTLVMTSLPLARVFQCLFTLAHVSDSHWLAKIWQLSRRGATWELEVEFKFQRCSCKLFLFPPPCRQSATENLLTGYVWSSGYANSLPRHGFLVSLLEI